MLLIPAGGPGLSKGRTPRGAQRIQWQAWARGGGKLERKKLPTAASFILNFILQDLRALHGQLGRMPGTRIACHTQSRTCVLGTGPPPLQACWEVLGGQCGTSGLGPGQGHADRSLALLKTTFKT